MVGPLRESSTPAWALPRANTARKSSCALRGPAAVDRQGGRAAWWRPQQAKLTAHLYALFRPQRFRESDAPFNVGVAVGAAQVLPSGVYVAMGGAVFSHEQCVRDLESGAFVALSPFDVNDKVLVEEPIEASFEDTPDLPKGTVGKVLSIDAEGDAYIDFGEMIGKQWVASAQFDKLWSPRDEEDPPLNADGINLFPP